VLPLIHDRCKIPGYDNDTYEIQSPYHQSIINQSIPLDPKDKKQPYDKCHLYQYSNLTNTVKRIKCNEWVYDRSIVLETFTTKVLFARKT
jgi:OCT family organic cation transporter-like MFS transporter 4/5